MNLNKVAKEITKAEGLKESVSIAQVKEIMRLLFTKYSLIEIIRMKRKYRGVK